MFIDICEESGFLGVLVYAKAVINIISILVPILLVIFLAIELAKIVFGSEENFKKHVKSIILKIIATSLVFFMPTFTNLFLSMLNETPYTETKCWDNANMTTVAMYKEIEKSNQKIQDEKEKKEQEKAEENRKRVEKVREEARKKNEKKAEEARKKQEKQNGSGSGGENDCKGNYNGTKYNLSNDEVIGLARMVTCEYGTDANGMSAVASHMANLYELRTHNNQTGGKSLYQYITTCGWYACARKLGDSSYDNSQAQQVVRSVLVEGKRTLPLYIDEFDWYPNDIRGASWESYKSYTPHVTQLNNVYGSSGKYYCITVSGNDGNIFFYTSTAEKYKNDKNL